MPTITESLRKVSGAISFDAMISDFYKHADFTSLRHIKSMISTMVSIFRIFPKHVGRRYGFLRVNRNVFLSC